MPELDISEERSVKKQNSIPIEREKLEAKLSEFFGANIKLVSPENLSYRVPPDEHFWGQHGGDKEQYLQLVKALPKIYDAVLAENDAKMFYVHLLQKDKNLYEQTMAWFERPAIRAWKLEDKYMCDDGRHRTYAAMELGVQIPIIVTAEYRYTNDGELENVEKHNAG